MLRSTSRILRLLALGALIAPAAATAQADSRPVVVVFTFANSALGSKSDYDGLTTGIQDLLITDLASNAKLRVVDRSHIGELLQEQNMTRTAQIDPQTAVRLGKILGAQYAVTGGFMADKSGNAVLTGHTIDIETSQISNPQKIAGKAEDVLGMIAQLSSKIAAEGNFPAKTPPRRPGSSGEADTKISTSQSGSPTKQLAVETYAKQLPTNIVEKTMKTKLDAATMKLYSRALEEMDSRNDAKATELLRQVKAKYPDFEPAQRNLDKLAKRAGP